MIGKLSRINSYSKKEFSKYINELKFGIYDSMSYDSLILKYLNDYSLDEFFNYLTHHLKVLNASLVFSNYKILFDYMEHSYSMFISRGVDERFFLTFYKVVITQANNILYNSISHDIESLYFMLISDHEKLIANSKKRQSTKQKDFVDEELYNLIMNGEYDKANELVFSSTNSLEEFASFFDRKLVPILIKIGHEWELGNISVAKEHLGTAVIEHIIDNFVSKKFDINENKNKKVVVAAPEGELHYLGVKTIFNILKMLKYEVYYLSVDTPNEDLADLIVEFNPDIVFLSVVLESNLVSLKELTLILQEKQNFNSKIYIGGKVLEKLDKIEETFGAKTYIKSLSQLLNNLN